MFCDGTQTVEHWQQLEFASHEGNLEGFSRSWGRGGGVDAGAYTHHVNLVQFVDFNEILDIPYIPARATYRAFPGMAEWGEGGMKMRATGAYTPARVL